MLHLTFSKDLFLRYPVWIAPSDHVLKVGDETALQSRTGDRRAYQQHDPHRVSA